MVGGVGVTIVNWYCLRAVNRKKDALSLQELEGKYTEQQLSEMGEYSPYFRYILWVSDRFERTEEICCTVRKQKDGCIVTIVQLDTLRRRRQPESVENLEMNQDERIDRALYLSYCEITAQIMLL